MKPFKQLYVGLGLGLCLALWLGRALGAPSATTVVYPTGVWPDDVNNVQAAVDGGGEVLLKAVSRSGAPMAFNFGTPEHLAGIEIETDVTVRGESVRGAHTVIRGGYFPLSGFTSVSRRIRGLEFKAFLEGAILVLGSRGQLEITDNQFSEAIGQPFPGGSVAEAIVMGGAGGPPLGFTGPVRIANNRVDLSTSPATYRFGVKIDGINGDLDFVSNDVSIGQRPTDGPVFLSYGVVMVRCHGEARVLGNVIHLGANEVFGGIVGIGSPDTLWRISHNRIISEAPLADGITLEGLTPGDDGQPVNVVGGVISDNVVIMHQSLYGGISLYGLVSGATVVGNSVRGDGSYGLQVSFANSPADETVGNQLVDNDLEDFHAAVADVFLDVNSRNTLVRGECRKVLDLGTGNSVFCHD